MSSSTESSMTEYRAPFVRRFRVPVHPLLTLIPHSIHEQPSSEQLNSKDTILQWIDDSETGGKKFRIKINIEGFHANEIQTRADGNILYIYGERIENKEQGTSKKILEQSYGLPLDIDAQSSHVTFPSLTTMQVDFLPKSTSISFNEIHAYVPSHNERKVIQNTRTTFHPVPILQFSDLAETPRKTDFQPSSSTTDVPSTQEDQSHQSSPTDSSSNVSLFFPLDFDSEVFYGSVFQPVVVTDDHNQRYLKMKLDIKDYDPAQIYVTVNDNDLIVRAKQTDFHKRVTLPPNIDLSSLALDYNDGSQLCISLKLLDEYCSFKYF